MIHKIIGLLAVVIGIVSGAAFLAAILLSWMVFLDGQNRLTIFLANMSIILFFYAWQTRRRK